MEDTRHQENQEDIRDVLLATSALHSNRDLGLESAGFITSVTELGDKHNLQIGDRVFCRSAGSLATHVRVDAKRGIKIPDRLSFEAVGLFSTHATMIRGLVEIGGLDCDDTVLVHSAADAMGIAAIQVALTRGVKPYASVANEEERRFLPSEHGIPESHIFSSLDGSFVAGIMESTRSRGVDAVVNSFSGELLHESWKCVAQGGIMIDLSGKDMADHGKLDMTMIQGNRGFHGIDTAALLSQKPALARRLLETSLKLYTDGLIKPISPVTRFDPGDIKLAFHQFRSNRPIGAVCIQFPVQIRHASERTAPTSSSAGWEGWEDRLPSGWPIAEPARSCSSLDRPLPVLESLARELNEPGCQVQIFPGSVADATTVEFVVRNAAKLIAGMLHLALVLKDEALLEMSFDSWTAATEAKVQGTWNLHHALKDQPLDFFVLLSSIYGVQGNPKQANYAAASTFLDSFVQFRQRQGLPASVIDLGVMQDIGFVSQHPAILENLRRAGARLICENDFFGSLQLAIRASSEPAPAPPSLSTSYASIPLDARGLGLKVQGTSQGGDNTQDAPRDDGDVLRRLVENAKRDPSALDDETAVAQVFASHVVECLKTLLIFGDNSDLDLNLGLAELGVDSLIAIELQSWWIQNFAAHVTIL
ncbi:KR-domain-containing protein [Aspergillus steynii IBT 23096]|uniref:KR-domain-containing protein n=1 Tax=Aspergillus steynii IBT 23096 TaxID=1392250 RepID=A0A2I2FU12_9EURO|nr:KR-domain-containing protein [Aspergillus steynii IBT 23096]PLB44091.1 KR-domain-containing protein [Aspergillus steynii IBT 23096]